MKNTLQKIIKFYKKLHIVKPVTVPIWVSSLMLLFIFCLLVVLILRTYFYKDPIYLSLPTNSTIFAIEYTAATNSNEFKAIARKSSMPNALFFADLEKYLVPEFESLQIPLAYLNKKLLTFQLFEGEIYPVLVLEFKSKDSMNLLPTFPGFSHSKKGNLLYISTAKKQLESMLSTTPKIYSSPKFRAAYINIPNNNIADLYFNHELLSNKHISGLFGVFENVNQLFSVTVASLRENDYGLFLATYTAPRTGVVFPYTRKKYNAKLPSYLLDNQELFIGGTSATSRILGLLKNLPEFNQDTNLVANKVYSLLNTFNLSTDSFKLLTKFLSSEYGISYNNEKELSFFFQPNKRSDSLAVQKELNNLTAFYNPKTISYLLQDGQVAEQLIPNTDVVGQPFNSNTTKFDLKEINKNIYWSNSTNTPFDFISTSSNPFVSLSLESSTLSDNKFFKYALSEFSPIADEVLFIKSSLFYTYLQDKFDKKDLPSSFTATNYFHDGLQTVTILQW